MKTYIRGLRGDAFKLANLKSLVENHGSAAVAESFGHSLELGITDPTAEGAITPYERDRFFSIGALARALSPLWYESLDPREGRMILREEAIDSTAFLNINGQIVYNMLLQGFVEADSGVFDKICTVIPTKYNGEKIAGVSLPTESGYEVAEGAEYDQGSIVEDYIETPATKKMGQIVPITKEAIFYDRTSMIQQQAAAVGKRLATHRLKRMLRVVLGITNEFKWKGTTYNTYQTSTPWINKIAAGASALVDWTDINECAMVLTRNTDPFTGEPIEPMIKDILVAPALMATAKRILNATEVRTGDGASATAQTISANPVGSMIQNIIVSQQLEMLLDAEGSMSQAQAAASYFIGDFKRAFAYMENWPLKTEQLGAGSYLDFTRDIVVAYKASERGAPAVIEPRAVLFQSAV